MPKYFFSSDSSSGGAENKEIFSLLKNLEERISKLEAALNFNTVQPDTVQKEIVLTESAKDLDEESDDYSDKEEKLEYQLGQFWFAKVGIIALGIGIAFFLTFPYKNFPAALPGIIGYFISGAFIISSNRTRKNFSYLSGYLLGIGLALLYFTTMRLYFFGHQNLISGITTEVILLSIVAAADLIVSILQDSAYLAALSLALGYSTAIISDSSYFIFISLSILSAAAVYLKIKFGWNNLLVWGIILTYFSHFIWFVNNPLLGKNIQTIITPQINLLFILFYALIFSYGNLVRKNLEEKFHTVLSTSLNALLSYGLFCLITFSMKPESLAGYHLIASVIFLAIGISFWVRERSRYSTFIYAMLGYLALSASIIAEFKSPELFILLCWQSLLVVSTAVWFRSKFIVVANFIIYLIIFIAYLAIEGKVNLISISFGIVALLSARILNWKKDHLELKTEQMRNAYLLSALFIIPYALYFAMPDRLISISWIAVAVLYYVLSLVLKNKKYRWMALLTLLLTVVYIFIIGFTSSDTTYRIISFIALGTVMIIVSLVYKRLHSSIKKIIKS